MQQGDGADDHIQLDLHCKYLRWGMGLSRGRETEKQRATITQKTMQSSRQRAWPHGGLPARQTRRNAAGYNAPRAASADRLNPVAALEHACHRLRDQRSQRRRTSRRDTRAPGRRQRAPAQAPCASRNWSSNSRSMRGASSCKTCATSAPASAGRRAPAHTESIASRRLLHRAQAPHRQQRPGRRQTGCAYPLPGQRWHGSVAAAAVCRRAVGVTSVSAPPRRPLQARPRHRRGCRHAGAAGEAAGRHRLHGPPPISTTSVNVGTRSTLSGRSSVLGMVAGRVVLDGQARGLVAAPAHAAALGVVGRPTTSISRSNAAGRAGAPAPRLTSTAARRGVSSATAGQPDRRARGAPRPTRPARARAARSRARRRSTARGPVLPAAAAAP